MSNQTRAAADPAAALPTSFDDIANDGLPVPRRYWSIAAIWLAMTMAVLDGVIANIALPTIAHELGANPTAAIWIINTYQIAIVMLLLPMASLGEIFGYRRVYACGLVVFVLASIGCCFSGSLIELSACRFAQGLGAAAIMAINSALVRLTYPAGRLGRGIGYNAIVVAISSAAGPTVAAGILAATSWRWLFAINVPIGLASLVIGIKALPSNDRSRRHFDWLSALLNAAAFAALFLGVEDLIGGHFGLRTVAAIIVMVGTTIALVRIANGATSPLIPVDLLRLPVLLRSYATSVCAFAAQMAGLVALPFYLQGRFGYSNVVTGMLITGFPLGVVVASPLSGVLSDRFPAGPLGATGLVVFAVGYGLLAAIGAGDKAVAVACLALAGFGMGLFQSPNNRLMLSQAPRQRTGAAAGMIAVARLLGQTLGALIAAFVFGLLGTSSVVPFMVAMGFGVLAALLSSTRGSGANPLERPIDSPKSEGNQDARAMCDIS